MRIDIGKGLSVAAAIDQAKGVANRTNHNYVSFTFNDIDLTVYNDSNIMDVVHIYTLECEVRRLKR